MRTMVAAAVFLGGHGVGSWQKPEIRVCLSQMVAHGRPVIPVLLPGAPPNPEINLFLRENTWVDLREGLTEEGLNLLIWGITGKKGGGRQPSAGSPEPRYEDEHTRKLGKELAAARLLLKERTIAGQNTEDIRERILELRREMRSGGRLQPGDFLGNGRFQLLETIGRGGFATVWRAWDEEKDEQVAIKILHSFHAEDRSRRERFLRGARKMQGLHHPGIVRIIGEPVEEAGYHFFVMEYIGGGDLRQAVLTGRLAKESILPLVLELGEAIYFAHQRQIIHRDIKPANVLMDKIHPKLTDFDLVRAFDSTGGTQTQGHLGTFLYTAPEVLIDAKDAGVAADIYSLAMTALFAFYGKDLPLDVYRQPDVFLAGLSCPPSLTATLLRGIAWLPERRPPSIHDFCQELLESERRPLRTVASRKAPKPHPGEERINKRDGSILVYIPGGEYVLGSDHPKDDASPIHRVILSPFWVGKFPVTNEQYGRFLKEDLKAPRPKFWGDTRFNQPRQPVVGVTWSEIRAYCAWAGLRLPSEAQWEAAARGKDQRRYPWGNTAPVYLRAYEGGEWVLPLVDAFPQEIGPFGTLGQSGIVSEMCADVWNKRAYDHRDKAQDPINVFGDYHWRCCRGGSDNSASYRSWISRNLGLEILGFRCMLPVRWDLTSWLCWTLVGLG
jgi:serine/threonine protein kinase